MYMQRGRGRLSEGHDVERLALEVGGDCVVKATERRTLGTDSHVGNVYRSVDKWKITTRFSWARRIHVARQDSAFRFTRVEYLFERVKHL